MPSDESNAAWETLFPARGGFFKHPQLAPDRSGLAVFHQLHCLVLAKIISPEKEEASNIHRTISEEDTGQPYTARRINTSHPHMSGTASTTCDSRSCVMQIATLSLSSKIYMGSVDLAWSTNAVTLAVSKIGLLDGRMGLFNNLKLNHFMYIHIFLNQFKRLIEDSSAVSFPRERPRGLSANL